MGAKRDERPGRYATQARTYDLTRSASPTVVRPVSKYLGPANGRRLLEIAAGHERAVAGRGQNGSQMAWSGYGTARTCRGLWLGSALDAGFHHQH